MQILTDVYAYLFEHYLNIYVLQGFKSEAEKFAGAETTYTIESFMPDGQALQCGTSHYFADNFARIFDIKYEDQTQKLQYGYSTSWGISTRIIGALVMSHSDNDGLVLP